MPDNDSPRRSSHIDSNNGTAIPSSPTRPVPPPPTLRPFLDNLPSPASFIKSPSLQHDLSEQDEPTPTKAVFDLGVRNRSGDEDGGEDEEEEVEIDDTEEFESHYSRQSSPATSSGSELDVEDEDDTGTNTRASTTGENGDDDGFDTSDITGIHRVSSMPTSSANPTHHHPLQTHSHTQASRSTTALGRHAYQNMPPPLPPPLPLYPPFYNKPPIPLPPSPSLTSLLRPPSLLNRSTTSTRPTSPDLSDHGGASDVETPGGDTEAQVTRSAYRTTPVPPTSPRVPTHEYYGFVLYLASTLAFALYLLWAYLPSPFLEKVGVRYYPDRWWAVAIPAWIVMLLVYIYTALAFFNVEYLTLGLGRVETIVDDAGSVAILDEYGRVRKGGSKRWVRDLEERRKREKVMESWERKKKGTGGGAGGGGSGSARGSKRKGKSSRREEREREDEWWGYTGAVTESGVGSGLSWRQIWNEGTDAVMDVPLGGVCEVLYGEGRDREE